MQITKDRIGQVDVLRVADTRVDALAAIAFKDTVQRLMADAQGRICLDLSGVEFVDSSGLGAIVACFKQATAPKTFELVGLQPAVQSVFALTHLDRVFRIHPDLPAALDGAPG